MNGTQGPLKPTLAARALGGPLVHLDRTGSTNDHARALALAGAPAGTVVMAQEQTAGRGRQGRSWTAPRGRALTLSVLLRPAAGQLALLPLACAVATCEACEAVASVRCAIKWPNDVLIGGRKVAGILIESRPQEGWAVVGIGLNVDTTADELGGELEATATSLRIAGGHPVDRSAALVSLMAGLDRWVGDDAAGAEQVLAAYRQRDALEGERIAWSVGSERLEGRAAGIDEEGNLVVFTTSGERIALDAGEVHLLR